ncbi:hypothetical protein DDW09_02120 [Sulfolobus sp. SCGC AB-777_L09]|nr:hypothetical protein DDW09_02120 [Sulfolobus sp. SCGC AB-777_L09]
MHDLVYFVTVLVVTLLSTQYFTLNSYFALKYKPIKEGSIYSLSDVTVVIPVYNEDQKIFKKVIESVYKSGLKFIVVGDGVKNPYKEITNRYGGKFIFLEKREGKRRALAEGLKHVKTRLVLFLDSDTLITRETVQNMVEHMIEGVGGVGANVRIWRVNDSPTTYYSDFFERISELVNRAINYFGNAIILSGQCVLYRVDIIRDFMLSKDFLEPKFMGRRLLISDDRDLTDYVISKGYKAVKAIDAIAYTKPPKNLAMFFKQVTRWTRANYITIFREFKQGLIFKRGYLYVFNSIYAIMLPIFTIFFSVMDFIKFHMLSHILKLLQIGLLLHKAEILILNLGLIISKIDRLVQLHPYFAFAIGFNIISFISTVFFVITLAKIIGDERLKMFVYGSIALVVQYVSAFYALFTFLNQSWSSRERPYKR